ncbi:MAG: PAS domain-containing protein [Pseudomonadota bacterium]
MRLRVIILVLALLAFLSASTGGWLYYYSLKNAALHDAEKDAENRLQLLSRQLTSLLSEHIRPTRALAGLKEMRRALENPEAIDTVNPILDNFAESLGLEVCYLMDARGLTIASSNRYSEDSFVGKDFSFRYYFQEAVAGRPATYLALGTTSGKRGVYYSHPVMDFSGKRILGVAIIKASVEMIESQLFTTSEGILMVIDPNGIVFIANRPEMKFKLLWNIPRDRIEAINASKQFGEGPWTWTGFSLEDEGHVNDTKLNRYLYSAMDLSGYPGWRILNLRSYKDIGRHLADPFLRVVGPVILIISLLIGISVFILYNKALQEIIRRITAENELRLSEERYRHIYHKTPVMLHSIDLKGRVVRVSDHWLETMGYTRDEVIGKPLTSFYSEESRYYAETVIFPEFFRTGFCKDIPYTYVRKDGTTIDTLLSCYGVRDDEGNVVRSLAVSVDVTEKNSVQKDLQKAKEKLSRYSLDLEHQVEKRTAELQGVQDKLRKLSGRIMEAQETERGAIARELHDQLGQVLTALRIDAVWIEKYLVHRDDAAAVRAARICSLIDDTIKDVRDMAFRLRPGVLDDLGLVDALEMLCRDVEQRADISCMFRHKGIPDLDGTLSTALYRISQEAVTNALKHAGASVIEVDLTVENDILMLKIKDDGCGFSMDDRAEYVGFGLTGMKERAILAGGALEILSGKGQGTEVQCTIVMGGYPV